MNNLVLNVWADLRQKRLVPVAAILLVALIAVPFLLIQPAEQPPAPSAANAASASSKPLEPIGSKALVKPAEQSISDDSALDAFLSKDPFKPVETLEDEAGVVADTIESSGTETADSGAGETPSSGGTGGSGGDTGTIDGGSGGGGTTQPTQPDKPAPQKYTYVLDVTFTEGEKGRSFKRLERLGIIPSESNPLLVFLGVTTASEASFIVDSTLTANGEGRCKPSPTDCGFLYLEPGQEHSFTDPQGKPYKIRIDQIRKVTVESLASAAAARKGTVASRDELPLTGQAPVALTAEGALPERRRFSLPLLSDFEIDPGGGQ